MILRGVSRTNGFGGATSGVTSTAWVGEAPDSVICGSLAGAARARYVRCRKDYCRPMDNIMADLVPILARLGTTLSRRSFVGWIAAAVPATRVPWLRRAVQQQRQHDAALLGALATAVLPTEL